MSLERDPVSAGARVIGWLLIAVGLMMTLLCGACTLGMLGASFHQRSGALLVAMLALVVGGLPALGGLVLIWAGWRINYPPQPKGRAVAKTFD